MLGKSDKNGEIYSVRKRGNHGNESMKYSALLHKTEH